MRIGILADTHDYLDPQVFEHFENCDEIWHGGDFGSVELAQQLREFKPLRGVYGNVDDQALRDLFPENDRFDCQGVSVWMTHIGGRPGRYDRQVAKMLAQDAPQLFICGHSHILRIEQDKKHGGMIYLNPGAAGNHGFHLVKTIVTLEFVAGRMGNLKVIELGARGARRAKTRTG